MLNKNELEKIVINSAEDLKAFEGQNITDKHIVLNVAVKNIKLGTLHSCVVEGGGIVCQKILDCHMENVNYIYADHISLSTFESCKKIQCGDYDDDADYSISASRFFNCREISANYATIQACLFKNFETLYLTVSDMCDCVISDIVCKNDCAISMEDGELTNISFTNITLENDSYLIEGAGSPWVENSLFENILTSRDDLEIFHLEETKGIIFKKTVEYCFVDEDSCKGLDSISSINNSEKDGDYDE